MINMTHSPNIDMRLRPLKLFLGHLAAAPSSSSSAEAGYASAPM
jgi:hypothetical protein